MRRQKQQAGKQERERERESNSQSNPDNTELQQIRQYFQDNHIKSIEFFNNELVITYSDGRGYRTWTSANTPELRQIQSYLQNQDKKSISLAELNQSQASKKNYLPWIIGGGVVLAGIIGIVIWLATRKKKGREE